MAASTFNSNELKVRSTLKKVHLKKKDGTGTEYTEYVTKFLTQIGTLLNVFLHFTLFVRVHFSSYCNAIHA